MENTDVRECRNFPQGDEFGPSVKKASLKQKTISGLILSIVLTIDLASYNDIDCYPTILNIKDVNF